MSVMARQPERGYRGFVDWSNDCVIDPGFLIGEGGDSEIFMGGTTSHGYQFNKWLYVGLGAGVQYNLDWKEYENERNQDKFIIPVFVEARTDHKWGRFTPFFSVRLGANCSDGGGVYFSPTVGYRFDWGRRVALNLGLGMSLYGTRMIGYEHIMNPGGGITIGDSYRYNGTHVKPTIRLGFEF